MERSVYWNATACCMPLKEETRCHVEMTTTTCPAYRDIEVHLQLYMLTYCPVRGITSLSTVFSLYISVATLSDHRLSGITLVVKSWNHPTRLHAYFSLHADYVTLCSTLHLVHGNSFLVLTLLEAWGCC